jgi:hypothetical protein
MPWSIATLQALLYREALAKKALMPKPATFVAFCGIAAIDARR